MRRRALLAASAASWDGGGSDENLPPESTTFEFPLYLNTKVIEQTSDYLFRSRPNDTIAEQLWGLYRDNTDYSTGKVSGQVVKSNPVYIDGALVTAVYDDMSSYILITDKYYGDYSEVIVVIDYAELWVEGYN